MAAPSRKKEKEKLSYADYCEWSDDKRYELIDGIAYAMNAPMRVHQEALMEIARQMANFFKGHKCRVYPAPFDVRLPSLSKKDEEIFNVVQPDITVVCDKKKLDEYGCIGAPDLVIEILSRSSSSYDNIKKRALYEKFGVREYWLVHPNDRLVTLYQLENGHYGRPEIFDRTTGVTSKIFPELQIELADIFEPDPPTVEGPTPAAWI